MGELKKEGIWQSSDEWTSSPTFKEGGDAKVWAMSFVSNELVCTCEIEEADFCTTEKKGDGKTRKKLPQALGRVIAKCCVAPFEAEPGNK